MKKIMMILMATLLAAQTSFASSEGERITKTYTEKFVKIALHTPNNYAVDALSQEIKNLDPIERLQLVDNLLKKLHAMADASEAKLELIDLAIIGVSVVIGLGLFTMVEAPQLKLILFLIPVVVGSGIGYTLSLPRTDGFGIPQAQRLDKQRITDLITAMESLRASLTLEVEAGPLLR